MKLLSLISMLLFSASMMSQPPGSLDIDFGEEGIVLTDITAGDDVANTVEIQPDGKIIVGGYCSAGSYENNMLCLRYHPDGSPDLSFGDNGVVIIDVQEDYSDVANDVAIQPNGKIVLAGYTEDYPEEKDAFLVRLNTDGSPDTDFGDNGIMILSCEEDYDEELRVVKYIEAEDKIMAAGGYLDNISDGGSFFSVRILENGNPDNSYSDNSLGVPGQYYYPNIGSGYPLYSCEDFVVLENGAMVYLANSESYNGYTHEIIVRSFEEDGSSNSDFGELPGLTTIDLDSDESVGSSIHKTTEGYTIIGHTEVDGGEFELVTIGLNNDGTGPTFIETSEYLNFDFQVPIKSYSSVLDSNNNIVVGGLIGTSNNQSFMVHRLTNEGISDMDFDEDGHVNVNLAVGMVADSECRDVVITDENQIIAVGWSYGNLALVKLTSDYNIQCYDPPDNFLNADTDSVYFDWEDYQNAELFEMEIDTDSTFSTDPQVYTTNESNYTLYDLEPFTEYYWHVRVIEPGVAENVTGDWSDTWYFFTGNGTISVTESATQTNVKVFPNPADENFQVSCSKDLVGGSFSILDQSLNIIYQGKIAGESSTINASSWNPGIYFLKIKDEVVKVVLK